MAVGAVFVDFIVFIASFSCPNSIQWHRAKSLKNAHFMRYRGVRNCASYDAFIAVFMLISAPFGETTIVKSIVFIWRTPQI